jgi:peptidoglycan/xylan/chitin deacetylase (PgdA/CDA1 family)
LKVPLFSKRPLAPACLTFFLLLSILAFPFAAKSSEQNSPDENSGFRIDLRARGLTQKEEDEGLLLRVNADFDEKNQNEQGHPLADYQPDFQHGHRIRYDDPDLKDIDLSISGPSAEGRWRLIFPDNVKIWLKTDDTTYDDLISSSFSQKTKLPFLAELKIEGIKGSRTPNDVRILAEFFPEESEQTYRDSLFLTVLETKFALTFDDGPLPDKTEKIVRALSKLYCDGEPVKAAFFQVTEKIRKFPDLARFVDENGHFEFDRALSLEHQDLTSVVSGGLKREILAWDKEIYLATGKKPERIIRNRYRKVMPRFEMELAELHARICGGELTFDFRAETEAMVVKKTLEILEGWNTKENPQLHPYPAILIFHEFPEVTYDHLGEIVGSLQDLGFVLVNFDLEKIY